ncbi:hypothetical protein BDA99DRAFT_274494 [Phascolomyces articulosus]|uniref:F-box domain-containing protein n=1 Tax=Phascolomyces articulosus TaxID=60185 RepID=A0AAD5K766_9FUNG|nr:hypothetical protein BDA99DRAFT_274494 [Phascolomyces articulosus]
MMHHSDEQCTDFIEQSPDEIICNIFSHMDEYSAARSLDVCRVWRYKLLDCPSPWRTIIIDDNDISTWEKQKVFRLLPILSSHVEKLHIRALPNRVKQHIELIKTGGFSNLKFLVFEYDDGALSLDLTNSIYSILPYIAQTLTSLELDSNTFMNISLKQLLPMCTRLQSIKLDVHSISKDWSDWPPRTDPLKKEQDRTLQCLRRIDLSSQYPVSISAIAPIFHLVPHLRNLILRCLFDGEGNILSVLDNHCPELVEIRTGYLNIPYYNEEINTNSTTTSPSIGTPRGSSGGTLQCLAISQLCSAKPLRDRLARNYDSLRIMGLNMDPEGSRHSNVSDWFALSSFAMKNLEILYIRNGCRAFYEHLPFILRCFPSLESLKIENYRQDNDIFELTDITSDSLFDTIAELEKLRSLYLHDFTIHGQGFKRMLSRFYHHHTPMMEGRQQNTDYKSSRNSLQDLQIHYCDGLSDSVLQLIGMIQSLQSLAISCYNIRDVVHTSNITQFAQSISEHLSQLSYLEISGIPLTKEAVKSIAKCNSLDTLCLGAIAGLTAGHIELLKKNISNVYIEN